MRTDELDFNLPPKLIAQTPAAERAGSRLLVYRRDGRSIEHRRFGDLVQLLQRGDLLVFNDARVIPARFALRKETGGVVEGLYLGVAAGGEWRVMLKNAGAAARPMRFVDAPSVRVEVVGRNGEEYLMRVDSARSALELLGEVGRMPLPPYIRREKVHDARDGEDLMRYQTVYARSAGAVAAPTAGLHFTPELMGELESAGVERAFVTLHVGMGTFKPVSAERLEEHVMHSEAYTIGAAAAEALNRARREGRRIVAVGTTSARVLESQPAGEGFVAREGETSIFIYPPYEWKHVSALITNFHLPRSTLIALVAAMVGLEEQRRIYAEAIGERYRFFSYGDGMMVV
jgi:S-adenosylmethionine:tRNA ribosyltransferase-isomerase